MEQTANNVNAIVENITAGSTETDPSPDEKARQEKMDCSHRVIEKRRRDRINNSLMQLSKLVPIEKYNKKNSGKLEKAEILEVTVHYLTQQRLKKEVEPFSEDFGDARESYQSNQNQLAFFLRGYKQCLSDATKFFQDVEELDVSEGRCYRLIQHLKRQVARYDNEERDLFSAVVAQRAIWEAEKPGDVTNRMKGEHLDPSKRKKSNDDLNDSPCKKTRTLNEESSSQSGQSGNSSSEQEDRSGGSSPSNSNNSDTSSNSDNMDSRNSSSRNYMPFVLPNIPLLTAFPFAGGNNMPRLQPPAAQFPGYQYTQSPQYIPVAVPQFPFMGMNFMPGFMNGEQSQNGSMTNQVPNGMPCQVPNQAMPGMMPSGMPNGFFPSMYTNGVHANIMSMRPMDSGYESSEKSSSSKNSSSDTSPQSFSDDSCQSYST